MPVIAQGERPGQVLRKRREGGEVGKPLLARQVVEADFAGGAVIAEAEGLLRKRRRFDRIVEGRTQREDRRVGFVRC